MSKQLNAIFNHAVKHYKLEENPARAAGSIGSNNAGEMQVWTREEYLRFAEAIKDSQEYIASQYSIQPTDRIFTVSVSYLLREIARGAQAVGIKRIRVHDMRHSHVSLLIDMGYSAVTIAKRVGHRSIDITFRYAHLFPSVQADMMKKLDKAKLEGGNENEK